MIGQLIPPPATAPCPSVGGAITTLPEMHRFLVDQQGWLSDAQFNASIAITQV